MAGREMQVLLTVSRSALHGDGCFTTSEIAAGDVLAVSRLLLFPPQETQALFATRLKNYLFYVRDGGPAEAGFHSALAMAPISFCNHSNQPNCDFVLNEERAEIILVARCDLRRNEEITIDYGDYAEEII